jgi:hypothetical protein
MTQDDEALAALTPEERKDVLAGRKRRAEEARVADHWAEVATDLSEAASGDDDPDCFEEDDWDEVAQRFCDRILPHWKGSGDALSEFAFGLMRSLGFKVRTVRGHGECWTRSR